MKDMKVHEDKLKEIFVNNHCHLTEQLLNYLKENPGLENCKDFSDLLLNVKANNVAIEIALLLSKLPLEKVEPFLNGLIKCVSTKMDEIMKHHTLFNAISKLMGEK